MLRNQIYYPERGNLKGHRGGIVSQVLLCIIGGLFSGSFVLGAGFQHSSANANFVGGIVQVNQSKAGIGQRRDPFQPIQKRRSNLISPSNAKTQPVIIEPIPIKKNPHWKLLGIFEGKHGRQAVIQLSPKKRVVVTVGLEVARSGWITKTIHPREILFESSSAFPDRKGFHPPHVFVLSFSPLTPSF